MGVLKIAKAGGNALTDSEKNLVMTSDRSCLVELFSGTVDITTNGSGYGSTSFTHNLGYRPVYYCFARDPLNTSRWYPHHDGTLACITSVDTTKLYVTINYKEPSKTYRVFYSIFGNNLDNSTGTGNNNVSGKLRIAKDGYDARTETDARNMKFFSGKNTLKIDTAKSGSVTQTVDDFVAITTITHNLGYVPMAFVLATSPYNQMLPNSSLLFPTFTYYITSTTLVIETTDLFYDSELMDPYDITFKYKILRDKIA